MSVQRLIKGRRNASQLSHTHNHTQPYALILPPRQSVGFTVSFIVPWEAQHTMFGDLFSPHRCMCIRRADTIIDKRGLIDRTDRQAGRQAVGWFIPA